MNKVLLSSVNCEWSTPQDLFDELDSEFHFTLDPCATDENHKCQKYYTKKDDGLSQSWGGETVFCNPPYGREIGKWVRKAHESVKEGATVVMLIPARTDTKWFHEHIYNKYEVRYLKGRIKFGGAKEGAPFPSMVVVMKGE